MSQTTIRDRASSLKNFIGHWNKTSAQEGQCPPIGNLGLRPVTCKLTGQSGANDLRTFEADLKKIAAIKHECPSGAYTRR